MKVSANSFTSARADLRHLQKMRCNARHSAKATLLEILSPAISPSIHIHGPWLLSPPQQQILYVKMCFRKMCISARPAAHIWGRGTRFFTLRTRLKQICSGNCTSFFLRQHIFFSFLVWCFSICAFV